MSCKKRLQQLHVASTYLLGKDLEANEKNLTSVEDDKVSHKKKMRADSVKQMPVKDILV